MDPDDELIDIDDDEPELLPCPECDRLVYEEAEQCPYCGAYIVRSNSPWQGRPTWWLIVGGAGVVMTLLALTQSC